MKSFQFTVLAAEDGYLVRVKHGKEEYVWPNSGTRRERDSEGLTTASQSRGEELSEG
jgi:hypothetical protein